MPRFWSNVLAVAYREARVLRHDQAFLAVITMQPIMMLILQGYVLSNKPANVPWAVLDRSQTTASRRLVADVQATGYFLPPRAIAGYDQAHDLLREGKALAWELGVLAVSGVIFMALALRTIGART